MIRTGLPVAAMAFTTWSSLAAPPFLLALSLWFEGEAAVAALQHPGWKALLSAAFLGYGATLFGYSLWARLLSRRPAVVVAPFLLGTFALAGFASANSNSCFKIGYAGVNRYVQLTITPTGNTSAYIAATAVLGGPHSAPTANPPV